MNPAEWVSAAVSAATGLVVLGGYFAVVREYGKRLDLHDELHKETQEHNAKQDVALAKLEAWQDGYRTAALRYGQQGAGALPRT